MASQSAVKKAGTTVKTASPSAVPTPKPARKPKTFDYSRYRQTIQNTDDFIRYLTGYPNKGGLIAYVYRLVPKIDLKLIGKETTYILETTEFDKITPAAIAEDFGRGKYLIILSDANRAKGEREVCKSIYRLEDEPKPAVYDIRTLVLSHGDNIDEVNRQLAAGTLVREPNGAPRIRTSEDHSQAEHPNGNGNGHSTNGDLFSRETMSQVLLKMIDKGSQNPGELMKQTIDVAKMMMPPQAAAPQLNTEQLVELVAARLERTVTRTNPEGDFISTFERFEGFRQKFMPPSMAPVTVPDGAAGWAAVAPQIIGQITALVPMVFGGLQQLQQLRNSQPRPGKRIAAGQQQQNGGHQEMTIADRIAEIAKLGFQRMQAGVNGHDYAAYVCNFMPGGLEVFRMLEPQGPAAVMGLASMNPETSPFLTDAGKRAQVEAFLVEFFSFDSEGVGAEELPPPAGASPAAGASA